MADDTARSQFTLRTKSGVISKTTSKTSYGPVDNAVLGSQYHAGDFYYSPDGSLMGLTTSATIAVVDAQSGEEKVVIEEAGVRKAKFSPLGSYLVTFTRWSKSQSIGNIAVWRVADGELVRRIVRKEFPRGPDSSWSPSWTSDEAMCVMGQGEVRFYDGHEFGTDAPVLSKLAPGGILAYSLAPGTGPYTVATYCKPVAKGGPSSIRMYRYPNFDRALTVLAISRVDEVDFMWRPDGGAVLATVSTEVDNTGDSYYGEKTLHYLRSDGEFTCAVPLIKDGPIYEAAWRPASNQFAVVHGRMPSKTVLYDAKCKAVFDFGSAGRNHVVFSPSGQFVAICGYGNLSGTTDFWSVDKLKLMGTTTANCPVYFGWSPCERFFLTASLFPRMRVDNGIQIWSYYGKLLHEESIDNELSKVEWRPLAADLFTTRPPSPIVDEAMRTGKPLGGAASGSGSAAAAPAKKAYVPPHLRGKAGAGSRSVRRSRSPPRRLDDKGNNAKGNNGRNANNNKKPKKPHGARGPTVKLVAGEKPTAQSFLLNVTDESPTAMLIKKCRNLRKKLRQINVLAERKAEGSDLSETQEVKLAAKEAVEEAIEILTARIQAAENDS